MYYRWVFLETLCFLFLFLIIIIIIIIVVVVVITIIIIITRGVTVVVCVTGGCSWKPWGLLLLLLLL